MLRDAHERGRVAALEVFGVKTSGWRDVAMGTLRGAKEMMIGHPEKVLDSKAWAPGGVLNVKSNLWPSAHITPEMGTGGRIGAHAMSWLGRLGAGFGAYDAVQAARGKSGDPNEGRLSNALSSVGGTVGTLLGYPLGGMLGAPLLGAAGARLGRGIGRTLGSHAAPNHEPAQQEAMPNLMPHEQSHPYGGAM